MAVAGLSTRRASETHNENVPARFDRARLDDRVEAEQKLGRLALAAGRRVVRHASRARGIYVVNDPHAGALGPCRLSKIRSNILLLGACQVGNSTLCRALAPDLYVDRADEREFLSFAKDPGRLRREVAALSTPGARRRRRGAAHPFDSQHRPVPRGPRAARLRFVLTGSRSERDTTRWASETSFGLGPVRRGAPRGSPSFGRCHAAAHGDPLEYLPGAFRSIMPPMTYTPRKAPPPPPIVGKPRQKCKEPECVNLAEHRRFYCFMHQTPKLRST